MDKEIPLVKFLTDNYDRLLKLSIMMLHDLNAAEDVLHNVAVSIYAKRESLNDVVDPPAYFFTCLRRAMFNYIRDNARTLSTDPFDMKEMRSDPKSKVALDYLEWEIILRNHLKEYSEELIQAFLDHYMDDYPLDILADRLGLTPNALSQQFRRMRVRIARRSPRMALYMFILTMR